MGHEQASSEKLPPEESDSQARLAKVFDAALAVYKDPDRAREFLFSSHQMLGGKTPHELAFATDIGAETVVTLIGRAACSGGV